jgi:5-methylcytosine-specific restriction endonuclease McrA
MPRRSKVSRPSVIAQPRRLKRTVSRDLIPRSVRRAVKERSGGWCEARVVGVCDRTATHIHHVVLRSRGGSHEASNLVHVCGACHSFIHHHPTWATARALMATNPKDHRDA